MTDVGELFARYNEVWNTHDEDFVRQRITETFTADGRFVDPMEDVAVVEPFVAHVRNVQEQFPTLTYHFGSDIDAHHDVARYDWKVMDGDKLVMTGMDSCIVADGRIKLVIGFFNT